jgi:hypothetical protein
MGKRALLTLVAALAVAAFTMSGVARAAATPTATPTAKASPTAAFSVDYYSNAGSTASNAIPASVRVCNVSGATEYGLFYVTDQDQELKECCSCEFTNGACRTLAVDGDLTANPANGEATANGNIALISASSSSDTKPVASGSLAAWSTHDQGNGWLTETPFTGEALSSTAESNLAAECSAVILVGSGTGICTCGTGD